MRTDIQTMPVCHGLEDAAADSLSFRISIDSRHKLSRLFDGQHRLWVAIGSLRCMPISIVLAGIYTFDALCPADVVVRPVISPSSHQRRLISALAL